MADEARYQILLFIVVRPFVEFDNRCSSARPWSGSGQVQVQLQLQLFVGRFLSLLTSRVWSHLRSSIFFDLGFYVISLIE